jgi:cytochrome c oxidase cbb3-type subunit 3
MTDKNEKYDVPIVGHEYDGIQELDNGAPFWWQLFFYLSIAFGFLYYAYYEFGTGASSDARLKQELTEVLKLQAKNEGIVPSDPEFDRLAGMASTLESGKKVFTTNCASCHAADGGGLIGPNLTDAYWIHGKGTYADLYKVVSGGVADKGMPAWKALVGKEDLLNVIVFVKSLQGTRPTVAKAPQGSEVK